MNTIASDVKHIISEICGLPSPQDDSEKLSELGFNNNMCSDLAAELDKYVKDNNPLVGVNDNDVAAGMSIEDIIKLVNKKIYL